MRALCAERLLGGCECVGSRIYSTAADAGVGVPVSPVEVTTSRPTAPPPHAQISASHPTHCPQGLRGAASTTISDDDDDALLPTFDADDSMLLEIEKQALRTSHHSHPAAGTASSTGAYTHAGSAAVMSRGGVATDTRRAGLAVFTPRHTHDRQGAAGERYLHMLFPSDVGNADATCGLCRH